MMARIAGDVVTAALPGPLDNPVERARIADELIEALVELHAVDFSTIGLEGFGQASGYLERQLRRFAGLWEHNRTRELEPVEQVGAWLVANMPSSPPATIGDPRADLGYMMSHWIEAGDRIGRYNLQNLTSLPGFPTRQQMIERYEQRSGRSMRALNWYVALALWKAIVFMEGNYKRASAGSTDDPYLKSFGEGVLELARRALDGTRHGI